MMSLNYRLFSFDQNRQVLNAVHEPLTARQLEVLALLCDGLSNKQIARQLNVAAGTVKIHVSNILRAMNVSTRLQAVIAVRSLGLHRFADPADRVHAGHRLLVRRPQGAGHVGAEMSVRIDQIRNLRCRQNRHPFHQHQMEADTQGRQPPGAGHRIGRGRAGHHKAGGGQNPVAMGALDRFIDFDSGAEIRSEEHTSELQSH